MLPTVVLVIHVMCLILLPGLANRVILWTKFQFSWDVLGRGQREAWRKDKGCTLYHARAIGFVREGKFPPIRSRYLVRSVW